MLVSATELAGHRLGEAARCLVFTQEPAHEGSLTRRFGTSAPFQPEVTGAGTLRPRDKSHPPNAAASLQLGRDGGEDAVRVPGPGEHGLETPREVCRLPGPKRAESGRGCHRNTQPKSHERKAETERRERHHRSGGDRDIEAREKFPHGEATLRAGSRQPSDFVQLELGEGPNRVLSALKSDKCL